MPKQNQIALSRTEDSTLVVRLSGSWSLDAGLPSAWAIEKEIESRSRPRGVTFDSEDLTAWDSSLVAFAVRVTELCRERGINTERDGLFEGVRRARSGATDAAVTALSQVLAQLAGEIAEAIRAIEAKRSLASGSAHVSSAAG